jgi:hypothetical protein
MIQEAVLTLLVIDLDKHIGNAQAWRDTFRDLKSAFGPRPATSRISNTRLHASRFCFDRP